MADKGDDPRMTRRSLALLAFVPLIPALGQRRDGDDLLYDRVHRKLNNHRALRIRDLQLEVSDGIVRILGTVRSGSVKRRAAKVASVKGVRKIVNDLTVGP